MRSLFFKQFTVGFLTIATLATTVFAAEYIVKKHDILSEIAHLSIPGKVWGEDGALQKLLVLNPIVKNPDMIYPGQILQLPVSSVLTESEDQPL
jgi:hypothetical protein